ncbi:MAG: hypothetical protein M5R42_06055 [Rhodocyclaceae bacterium]|nr:hypothetical protein [Rhodocyclaceae bacterium]
MLLHLDSSQPERMEEALDMAEAYLAKASNARVEIVVTNSGLDLLREESTPYAARIAALASRHEMLAFVACGNAIARYRNAGLDVTLVPEAMVAGTAVEHVVERVRQVDLPEDLSRSRLGQADAGIRGHQTERQEGGQHLGFVPQSAVGLLEFNWRIIHLLCRPGIWRRSATPVSQSYGSANSLDQRIIQCSNKTAQRAKR